MVKIPYKLEAFFGSYQKEAGRLSREGFPGFLQIAQRKTVTATKPPHYLVYKAPEGDVYLSSMYPIPNRESCYKIELGGILGMVHITTTTAEIEPFRTNSRMNNNWEFVSSHNTLSENGRD